MISEVVFEMSAKVIRDISYMENTVQTTIGSRLPEEVGEIYHPSKHYAVIGQRFALLLREAGFKLTDFERLVIVFSQAMPKGEAAISERITDKWMRYVDYGLSVEDFERLSDAEKQQEIFQLTKAILLNFFADTKEKKRMVEDAAKKIENDGEALDIVYQMKNDKAVNVKVMAKLFDNGECQMNVLVESMAGKLIKEQQLVRAESLAQALQYAGTILIRKNRVVIKPINNVLTKDLQPVEIIFELA